MIRSFIADRIMIYLMSVGTESRHAFTCQGTRRAGDCQYQISLERVLHPPLFTSHTVSIAPTHASSSPRILAETYKAQHSSPQPSLQDFLCNLRPLRLPQKHSVILAPSSLPSPLNMDCLHSLHPHRPLGLIGMADCTNQARSGHCPPLRRLQTMMPG